MQKQLLGLFCMLVFLMAAKIAAGDVKMIAPKGPVGQGEVAAIQLAGLTEAAEVKGVWQGQPVEFFQHGEEEYSCLLGIDLSLKPDTYPLEVHVESSGNKVRVYRTGIEVVKTDYGVQHLTLPADMVTLDGATLKRVRREGAEFKKLWDVYTPKRYWYGSFVQPVEGRLTSTFGLRRILNGEPRSSHSGVDLSAALGEPVRAANHGRVVLVGEFFFHGKAVVLDHGWGLYTMYFHLSEVNVSQGDLVGKNCVIGLAGSTGRVTGPHLHWGVRLGGARVDPFALVRATGG
jgi:murein DD-endopeptidase MepM/ murein hydrolase activator NlpD